MENGEEHRLGQRLGRRAAGKEADYYFWLCLLVAVSTD